MAASWLAVAESLMLSLAWMRVQLLAEAFPELRTDNWAFLTGVSGREGAFQARLIEPLPQLLADLVGSPPLANVTLDDAIAQASLMDPLGLA
mmetsp:Transcript_122968/g.216689  ORF Transcript_122968/g.216689 Transcript_122968/m.216689 type:complete len:92 (-) Transcript_122968:13-288(-)